MSATGQGPHREPGETVAPGAVVLTLLDLGDRWVRIYVPETRLPAPHVSTPAVLPCDTFPGKAYAGEVVFVASKAQFTPKSVQTQEERVRLVYAAKVRVEGDPAFELKPGMPADLAAGRGTTVQLLFDGTNSNLATVARGYAERIVEGFGARLVASGVTAPVGLAPPVELTERAWFNPDLESRNYNVPAVVGAILMLVCLLLTSLAVVREREIGTLEQLLVSPLRPWELLVGKTIPFALIGLLDLVIVTAVALLWFEVPFRGSFLLMLAASILYLLSALGMGLLVSTIADTQQEAFMSTFLLFMPAMLLSGFLFPVGSMPQLFQWLTLANPMRHYLEIVRAVFLKGAGFEALEQQYAALLLLGGVIFGAAVLRFRARER